MPHETHRLTLHRRLGRLGLVAILSGSACATSEHETPALKPEPHAGFCDLPDHRIEPYLIAVNVAGWTSASGVATIRDGQLVVLTNRHNLPPEPDLDLVTLRNHRYAVTKPTSIIAFGEPLDWAGTPGPARDFVVLTVRDPDRFKPLPVTTRRHEGQIIVPSLAGRLFSVERGSQKADAEGYDQLDLALPEGSSGAPVLTCMGEIAGLYTARIVEDDWPAAGFKGVATPITEISLP